MAPGDPLQAREAGLRRLLLAKRWVLAGSVTLTGLLAGVHNRGRSVIGIR